MRECKYKEPKKCPWGCVIHPDKCALDPRERCYLEEEKYEMCRLELEGGLVNE